MPNDSGVTIIIAGEDQSGAVMDAVEARLKRASQSAEQFGRSFRAAGEGGIPPMIAASASVRALQGNLEHNTRAVERFLSTTLKLGPVFETLFPLVGAITFGALLLEDGKKLYDLYVTAQGVTTAIHDAFAELNAQGQLANDELEVTNDKLRDTIAKLQGKPKNGIKDAIDEALVEAEKLYIKLVQDDAKISEILAKNHVGAITLTGQVPTTPVDDVFKSYDQGAKAIAFAANQQVEALRKVNDQAGVQRVRDKERVDLLDLQAKKIAEISGIEKKAESDKAANVALAKPGTFDANPANSAFNARIETARGVIAAIEEQSSGLNESADNEKLTKTAKSLEGVNEELKKQQEYLEKIAKLGIGNIFSGNLNVSEQVRRAQAGKLDDKSRDDLQGKLEADQKQREQEKADAAEKQRIADELAKQQYEVSREIQDSRIRDAEETRRITDAQAQYDLTTGRITAQQRIQIDRDAAAQELSVKRDALAELRALDVAKAPANEAPRELQRDLDAQKVIEQQHNLEMLQIDQQSYEQRRAIIQPLVADIFQPLIDKPKSVSEAFKKMADDILKSLERIATQKLTEGITNLALGGGASPGGGSSGGARQPSGVATRGIGGILGQLFGGLMGRTSNAKTGANNVPPTDTAAALGGSGSGGDVQVTIINQSSSPVAAGASSSSKDAMGNIILTHILKDASTGGPMTQALSGAIKLFGGG